MNAWSPSLPMAMRAAAFAAAVVLLHACNGGGDDAPKFETNAPLTWSSIATQALVEVGTTFSPPGRATCQNRPLPATLEPSA